MEILGHKVIFKTIVGSQSYGTNIEGSDIDHKGVFIQDPKDLYLNGYKPEINISKDEVYFEVGRFLNLCSTGNPTVLELLYAPESCVQYIDPIFEAIVRIRDIFLTKSLRYSFGNYASEQIKKASGLDKKMNWENERFERKSVEDMCSIYPLRKSIWTKIKIFLSGNKINNTAISLHDFLKENNIQSKNCGLIRIKHFRDCYLLFNEENLKYKGVSSGENANDISLSIIPKGKSPKAILFFHKDAYSTHCKEYKEYEKWKTDRNELRYVDIEGHGQKIDGKNILHCVRLIETALEIPLTNSINVRRENAEYLIDIRKGKYDLQTLLDKCEKDLKSINEVFLNSDLPDKFEHKLVIEKLIKDIKEDNFYSKQKITSF